MDSFVGRSELALNLTSHRLQETKTTFVLVQETIILTSFPEVTVEMHLLQKRQESGKVWLASQKPTQIVQITPSLPKRKELSKNLDRVDTLA